MKDWLLFGFIDLLFPLMGIAAYFVLVRKMQREEIPNPPTLQLFSVFGLYGVVLVLVITTLLGKWSAMASLGGFAALTLGPIIAAVSAYSLRKQRRHSPYHRWAYLLSAFYVASTLVAVAFTFIYQSFR